MSINNVEELRSFLSEELLRLRGKEASAAKANAASNIAGKIMTSVKMEIEYNKMVGSNPSISFLKKKGKKLLKG